MLNFSPDDGRRLQGLYLIKEISDISDEEPRQRNTFPTLDAILGIGEEPKQNHGDDHHAEVNGSDALRAHRRDDAGDTKNHQDVEHIGA